MIITALDDFYRATFDFFSPMVLFNFVNEKVAQIARKQTEDKKKKENEQFLIALKSDLTPEQEAERARKHREYINELEIMSDQKSSFKGFERPEWANIVKK